MSLLSLICVLAAAGQAYSAALPTNQVEVVFYMDKAVVDKYMASGSGVDEQTAKANINVDVDYFISEINKIFEKVEGFSVGILKRDFVIMEKNLFAGPNVERDQGLKDFDAWRKEQGTHGKYNQDVAVLWTGLELVRNGNPATAGYANVGKICDPATSSLIAEFDGTYKGVVVTAHEIGHVLGSGHDSDTLRRVMGSEAYAGSSNRWQFSSESAARMKTTTATQTCLSETDPSSTLLKIEAPADVTNPDNICKRMEKNPDSYMIKNKQFYEMIPPGGDLICKAIFCFNGEVDSADAAYSSDGMLCGKNKRCSEGKCVDSPDAASGAVVSDTCVFGDQRQLNLAGFSGDCKKLVNKFGKGICYHYDSMCCETCAAHKSDDATCMYGNKSPKCAGKSQASVCGGSSATCCELCKGWAGKRSAEDNGSVIEPEDDGPKQEANKKGIEGTPADD